ncbi:hypothetical protein [Aurantimonas sp. VKM B-3413]|uniref:hypothetical protein n=1 Tax=Aurantimonas sp. VKM B-3413 TaxID=2779401 RepID=UPI001E31DD9A|nr:hypothetical protein [Aurantimonas sp. VKM B-3413]MCB8839167.1 hypothetical protein [Aurantimonas sp. VKM B-3413]
MHMAKALRGAQRGAVIAAALGLMSACTSTNLNSDLAQPSQDPAKPAYAEQAVGTEAPFCPNITLREGTAILQRKVGEKLDYQASIAQATRDCRIVNGQLHIVVGVIGRVMPGLGATTRAVELPIRVAVTSGESVVYSNLGKVTVQITKGGIAQSFKYVDDGITIAQPSSRAVHIFAGFDEGPAE